MLVLINTEKNGMSLDGERHTDGGVRSREHRHVRGDLTTSTKGLIGAQHGRLL